MKNRDLDRRPVGQRRPRTRLSSALAQAQCTPAEPCSSDQCSVQQWMKIERSSSQDSRVGSRVASLIWLPVSFALAFGVAFLGQNYLSAAVAPTTVKTFSQNPSGDLSGTKSGATALNEDAVSLISRGKLDDAEQKLGQAIRIDPSFAIARRNLNACETLKAAQRMKNAQGAHSARALADSDTSQSANYSED